MAGASSGAVGGMLPTFEIPFLILCCSRTWQSLISDQSTDAGLFHVKHESHATTKFYQAYSPALPVGAQRHYKSSLDALTTIFRTEGFRGYFRGMDASILRTSMGSSVSRDGLPIV